jgi:hypothetical protein
MARVQGRAALPILAKVFGSLGAVALIIALIIAAVLAGVRAFMDEFWELWLIPLFPTFFGVVFGSVGLGFFIASRRKPAIAGNTVTPNIADPTGHSLEERGMAPPAFGRRTSRRWLLIAGISTAMSLVVMIVVLLLVFRHDGRADLQTPSSASGPLHAPSPVIGRIDDTQAGLSYARLGPPWTTATSPWTGPGMFTGGQTAVVQPPINGASFNATSLSGVPRPVERQGYRSAADLAMVAARVRARIERELFTVEHTDTPLSSGPYRVPGGQGWLERFQLNFPQAQARGWKVKTDTMAVLLVDHGDKTGGGPSLLMLSVPDVFSQGDLTQVLTSVRTL